MHSDEPPALPELSPEEVSARVSAILEAAERDARAVILEAYREQRQQPAAAGIDELAREVARLAARVEALEQALESGAPQAGESAPQRAADIGSPAARVRAVELALAGLSREAIVVELSRMLAPAEVELLLDDVLSG
jgi:cell pole-organizing protein PopZ